MRHIAHAYTPYAHRVLALLAAVVALSVVLYGIFLLEAVGNTAKRTAAERAIRSLTSEVSTLEQAYLTHTRDITAARAQALGFVSPESITTLYATRAEHALTLGR